VSPPPRPGGSGVLPPALESRAIARKPRDAAVVLFGLKFADNIQYKFQSSQDSNRKPDFRAPNIPAQNRIYRKMAIQGRSRSRVSESVERRYGTHHHHEHAPSWSVAVSTRCCQRLLSYERISTLSSGLGCEAEDQLPGCVARYDVDVQGTPPIPGEPSD